MTDKEPERLYQVWAYKDLPDNDYVAGFLHPSFDSDPGKPPFMLFNLESIISFKYQEAVRTKDLMKALGYTIHIYARVD